MDGIDSGQCNVDALSLSLSLSLHLVLCVQMCLIDIYIYDTCVYIHIHTYTFIHRRCGPKSGISFGPTPTLAPMNAIGQGAPQGMSGGVSA